MVERRPRGYRVFDWRNDELARRFEGLASADELLYKILPLQIGYDRYSSQYLISQLEQASYHCESVFQGWNLGGIEDNFEGMLREGRIRCIDDNDLLKIHFADAAQQMESSTENAHPRKKLVKISKYAHVDGMAAVLDAMAMRQFKWADLGKRLENKRKQKAAAAEG